MKIEQRLQALGIALPEAAKPLAMYVPVKQTGKILYISGQIPAVDGKPAFLGKVGEDVTLEQAQEAARLCIVNMLSVVKGHIGDLDRVRQVVSIQAIVASRTGFDQQHVVANAASQLLWDVFGEAGRHARTAVGTNQLPLNVPIEIMGAFEIEA